MRGAVSIVIAGLAIFSAAQAWAGTTGNGSAQRNGPKTHYSYCFGGLRETVYFSRIITSAPSVTKPDLGIKFGAYLTKTYGVGSNNGGQCIVSESMADTTNGKKQREAEFVWRKWKIIETDWAG